MIITEEIDKLIKEGTRLTKKAMEHQRYNREEEMNKAYTIAFRKEVEVATTLDKIKHAKAMIYWVSALLCSFKTHHTKVLDNIQEILNAHAKASLGITCPDCFILDEDETEAFLKALEKTAKPIKYKYIIPGNKQPDGSYVFKMNLETKSDTEDS